MALLHPAVAEGMRVVARQAAETATALTSAVVSEIVSATPSPTGATLTFSASASSVSDMTANGGPSNSNLPPTQNSGNNTTTQSGGNSSPLLFFVALGFGVVFTNLW